MNSIKDKDEKKIVNNLSEDHKNNSIIKPFNNKNIISNVPVKVTVELGSTRIKIKDLLNFSKGDLIILDQLIKDPLNIFINDNLFAIGEIVMLEKKYGLRIISINNSF